MSEPVEAALVACDCFPHGPDDPCTCDGCWACTGHVVGCTCGIAWDCEHREEQTSCQSCHQCDHPLVQHGERGCTATNPTLWTYRAWCGCQHARKQQSLIEAALLACPAGPHWCQNPENPNGYSMHALDHDPYAAQRAEETRMTDEHAHCWHGNQSHPDPSCCLCDSSGCPLTKRERPGRYVVTVTDPQGVVIFVGTPCDPAVDTFDLTATSLARRLRCDIGDVSRLTAGKTKNG